MLLYAAMDAAIYLKLVDFVTGFRNAMSATDSLTFITAKHVSESRPWEWVFNLEIMPYWYGPHYIGLVSFPVWALIVPTVVYTAFRSIKKDTAALFSIASFIGVYLVWIPLDIATNRISFIYYFLPAVPGVCLGLGIGMDYLINFWQAPRPPRTPESKPHPSPPSRGKALRRRTASPHHPRRARPSSGRLPAIGAGPRRPRLPDRHRNSLRSSRPSAVARPSFNGLLSLSSRCSSCSRSLRS